MLNKILYGSYYSSVLTDADIYGGCSYTHIINNGTDWLPGVASCAELIFTSNHVFTVGESIKWQVLMEGESAYTQKGVFNIKSRKRIKDKYTYTCYDNMILMEDTNISSTWEGLWGTNKTLYQIYNAICNASGVITGSSSFTNSTYTVDKKRFNCTNTTARQILAYIAEVAGGYAYADSSGYICIKNLGTSSLHTFTNSEYKSVELGTDPVNVIDSVWSGAISDDTGILVEEISGTHDNTIKLVGNPLLYNDGPNTLPTTQYTRVITALNNILDVVPVSYKATNISLFKDFNLNVGSKVQVIDSIGTHVFYIFSKYITSSGVVFKCSGNTDREVYVSPYDNITGVSTSVSSLKIDNDQIKGEVSNLQGDVSAIEISLDSIDLTVTNSGTTSLIKLSKDGTVIASPTVTMTGKVSFTDLSTAGSTTINGANITTGTVNCNRLIVDTSNNIGGESSLLGTIGAKQLFLTRQASSTTNQFNPLSEGGAIKLQLPSTASSSGTTVTVLSTEGVKIWQGSALTTEKSWSSILAGGGGGTSDYTQLTNKPQINGVTLTGNKTTSDLGIVALFG